MNYHISFYAAYKWSILTVAHAFPAFEFRFWNKDKATVHDASTTDQCLSIDLHFLFVTFFQELWVNRFHECWQGRFGLFVCGLMKIKYLYWWLNPTWENDLTFQMLHFMKLNLLKTSEFESFTAIPVEIIVCTHWKTNTLILIILLFVGPTLYTSKMPYDRMKRAEGSGHMHASPYANDV